MTYYRILKHTGDGLYRAQRRVRVLGIPLWWVDLEHLMISPSCYKTYDSMSEATKIVAEHKEGKGGLLQHVDSWVVV